MIQRTRTEHDFLGEKQIPMNAYWGVHTARAVENFPISGIAISAMPDLIRAFGFVKKAASCSSTRSSPSWAGVCLKASNISTKAAVRS